MPRVIRKWWLLEHRVSALTSPGKLLEGSGVPSREQGGEAAREKREDCSRAETVSNSGTQLDYRLRAKERTGFGEVPRG